MLGKAQAVLGHRRLDRRAHLGGGAEEAVGRGEPLQPLVRALEVVVLHEDGHPPLAVLEVGEHGAREKLLPHRLPEALDLAAGLRVMRPALYMPDALAAKLLFEPRLAPPRGVLAPLVGQDLPRCAVGGDRARERLHHQRALLVMRHREAHQIARVIIQERCHIDPLVAAQEEGEEVRLPQLIGLGPLETLLLRLGLGLGGFAPLGEPSGPQHPAHRRLGGADTEEALHHVADAPAARLRLLAFRRHNRLTPCIAPSGPSAAPASRPRFQPRTSTGAVLLYPALERRIGYPQLFGNALCDYPLIHHHRGRRHHHIHRPRRSGFPAARDISTPLQRVLHFRFHLSSPFGLPSQPDRRTSAR
jgi:hypothetical protein